MRAQILDRIPARTSNAYYLANREPLLRAPLQKLPLGSVRPKGWLKTQLGLMASGMTGRLTELSKFLAPDNGWFGGGNPGWEEQPYWLRGFHDLAVLTGEDALLSEAERWVGAVLESQDADGYFGATCHKRVVGKNGVETCDLWPHMVMLDALIHHYEHTHDKRVPTLMKRFFEFCRDLPDERFMSHLGDPDFGDWKPRIQYDRAGDMVSHLHWFYNLTGELWLLDLATRFFAHIKPPEDEWLDHHVIHFTQRFSYPGRFYPQSRAQWHLRQTFYWYDQHLATWGQQPRGIFGADERIRPGGVDPRQGFETCGFGEFNKSFFEMGRITGDPIWADRTEDLTLNHFPASQTPDLKALHYLTASNQPQLDASEQHEYRNKGRQISYSPHVYRCCQHNVAMTWPWYVQHLWQATADNGLAAWLYAPCEVTAQVGDGAEVMIVCDTEYPFRQRVTMTVQTASDVSFPLYLRVPGWCPRFNIRVNGLTVDAKPPPRSFVRIERIWSDCDIIEIDMAMVLSLTEWPRTGAVTVDRGPLSYSVKIGERWERCGGTDEWPEWEVFPTTPWNYGLVIDREKPDVSLEIFEKDTVDAQPWTVEAAPVEIQARAKQLPDWALENETVQELPQSPVVSDRPEEIIRLIPLGCARLRMSCLPVIA